ncbi:DUF6221 family protein (plasmid) [Microtetraspora malaysiensis]|uniref:DUF6221 family protein n=1 Tax=Microtetraspora malaysiensis TaxID=161358 RepID=UPI003D89C54E
MIDPYLFREELVFPEELGAFILARLDERQAAAEKTTDEEYELNVGRSTSYHSVDHAELHTPSWVLRDVSSKRRLLAAIRGQIGDDDPNTWLPWAALRLLAAPFAGHDDYRPEWAPTGIDEEGSPE